MFEIKLAQLLLLALVSFLVLLDYLFIWIDVSPLKVLREVLGNLNLSWPNALYFEHFHRFQLECMQAVSFEDHFSCILIDAILCITSAEP